MKSMKVLYLETSMWEFDFITQDVLMNINAEVEFFNKDNFKLFSTREDLINKNILILNEVIHLNDIIDIVKIINPLVIMYLSDEMGDKPEILILEKYCKLFLRQYNHIHYSYSNNDYQLPLGYVKSFLKGKSSMSIDNKKIFDREFNCSFIGSNKSDRLHMANVFNNNMNKTNIQFVDNNWDVNNLICSPHECFDVYENSIFTVIGRGNKALDCFRIYEAIVAGSIPVIVGEMEEINHSFYYNGNLPPLLYATTWENAVIRCNELLKNYKQLQQMQDSIKTWWKNQLCFINSLIIDVV